MPRAHHCHCVLISVLILIGALFACAPAPTPIASVPTATILPLTDTPTPQPTRPPATETSTPIVTAQQSVGSVTSTATNGIQPILDTTVPINSEDLQRLLDDLAMRLDIDSSRIQLVTVETARWDIETLGCELLSAEDIVQQGLDNITVVAGLRYVLLVGDTLYEYHTVSASGRFVLCDSRETIRDALLIAVDPFAAETFRSVQTQLASDLDLSSRLVELVTMQPVTWTDTSLGCPQTGRIYTEVAIPGYHIVVSVGETEYIYHSDSIDVYPCPAGQSVLPDEADS